MISRSNRLRTSNDSTWFLFWEIQIFHVYKTVYSSHESVFDWCQIETMNFYLCHVFKTYFVWNDKTSLFFAIIYFKKFRLFFRVNSTRIAKSRRDLLVTRLIFGSCDIKSRMKKLALRDRKDESILFKTNSCFFLWEMRRYFIIRMMINICKILFIEKRFYIKW
jgi:hypothetical protein